MATERQSLKGTSGRGLWWLIPFDVLFGCLFLPLAAGDLVQIRFHDTVPDGSTGLINLIAFLIDTGIAAALLATGFLLLRQKQAAPFQRAAIWALLLRSGLVTAELFLPGEGGIDGILRVGVLLVLVPLTLVALAAAVLLGRQEKQEQPLQPQVDQ